MFIGYTVSAVLVGLMPAFSGRGVIVRDERVMASLAAVEVSHSWVLPLAAMKFGGALGLLVGILYRPLGIAAGIGVVLFFVGAVGAHLRMKDGKGAVAPGVLVLVSAVPLLFGIASA